MTDYFFSAAHEQFSPSDLLEQAVAAERAGFDGIGASDHFQPWWEPGESGHAWVWLGAAAQATSRVPLGTAVTAPIYRYHPALVAQAWATLEEMYPGRPFLGVGSGESLNESPLGMDWPPVGEQLDRLEEALQIMRRLFDGERLDTFGHFPMKQAYLHTNPGRRPPMYVSAFGEQAAGVAARHGDGLWTLADPETVPDLLDAYRAACDDAGKEPGKVILQAGFSWAEDDDAAFEGAKPSRQRCLTSSTPTTGTTRRRWRSTRTRSTPTTSSASSSSSARTPSSTWSGSARWSSSAPTWWC